MNDSRTCTESSAKSAHDVPEAFTGWEPIETAPMDGTIVLATWRDSWPKSPHLEAVYRYAGTWYYAYDGDCHTRSPTHWMPLPEQPE